MPSKCDKHRYKRVSYDGSSFICLPEELAGMLEAHSEDGDVKYEVSDVWMTDEEYERLPEFEGF